MGKNAKQKIERAAQRKAAQKQPAKRSLKWILRAIIVSVVVLIVTLLALPDKQPVSVIDGLDLNQPQQVLDRVLANMKMVAEKTQDQEAFKVYDFFSQNVLVTRLLSVRSEMMGVSAQRAYYEKDGQEIKRKPNNLLGFQVVRPEDVTPENFMFYSDNALERLFYNQEAKTVFVSQKRLAEHSQTMMAFIFFHEACHSYQDYKAGYAPATKESRERNERAAYAFEARLYSKYLGKKYDNLFSQMVSEVRAGYRVNPKHQKTLQKILWEDQGLKDAEVIFMVMEMQATLSARDR